MKQKKIFYITFFIFIIYFISGFVFIKNSHAEDLMDNSKLRVREMTEMNMTGILPNYVPGAASPFSSFSSFSEGHEYNLSRMRQMNPDFTTYPEAQGIIWLKHIGVSRSVSSGMDIARLYVILGRRGLNSKWLNWNIPVPSNGSIEFFESSVFEHPSGAKVSDISPEINEISGINTIRFTGLPENFILVVSWVEHLPDQLSIEGLCWFQEELPVWESIVEVRSPQSLAYKTFPDERSTPDVQSEGNETLYTWRKINLEAFNSSGEIARLQKSGVAFSTRRGDSGILKLMRDIESTGKIPASSEAISGFKKSKNEGTKNLLSWLKNQPEISLTEGSLRKIPFSAPWTKREKIILARSWLRENSVEASLNFKIPFEPDEVTPLCDSLFDDPVLEIQGIKDINFFDTEDEKLLSGTKIFFVTSDGKIISRRIPSSSSSENKLSAIMDLKLNEHGMLSGPVRLILRGAWGAFLMRHEISDGQVRGALLSLFPGLTNYNNVKYKTVKGVPEISFNLENKPGVGGTGQGFLAILPFFEPPFVRSLGNMAPPVEIKFPFILEQNITIGLPKKAEKALVSGKVDRSREKINYSENYQNRRHRLIAESRFELNMSSVSSGNMSLLRRNLDQWRSFSARHIPVR